MKTTKSPTTTLPIPYELLRQTFGYLASDPKSLCALSLSSSFFTQEAQQLLFRDVDTTDWEYKRLLSFSRTIAASPERLALHVQLYTLNCIWPDEPFQCAEFLIAIRDSLQAMCNIKQLDIETEDTVWPSDHGIARGLLGGCTFSLETLEWMHDSSERDAEAFFEHILPKQGLLKHLGMDPTESLGAYLTRPGLILSSICPDLTSLRGPWNLIKAMLPGHKIVEVDIIGGYGEGPINDADISSVSSELARIEHLSYSLRCFPWAMTCILQHCSSVEVLSLDDFLEGFHDDILYNLPRLPMFDTLIVSLSFLHCNSTRTRAGQLEFVDRIFKKNGKNLQFVELMMDDDEDTYACYARSDSEDDASDLRDDDDDEEEESGF